MSGGTLSAGAAARRRLRRRHAANAVYLYKKSKAKILTVRSVLAFFADAVESVYLLIDHFARHPAVDDQILTGDETALV